MMLYIPTYGRTTQQRTYEALPRSLQLNVLFVVYKEEESFFRSHYNGMYVVCPKNVRGIGAKRQFIAAYHLDNFKDPSFVMLDDDLSFTVRRKDDETKFRAAHDRDIVELFGEIQRQLKQWAHVGVVSREGGNRFAGVRTVQATRMVRILGYNARILRDEKINFIRGGNMCDFDVTLQLLRKGYPNIVLCEWAQGQGSSNAPGGCSITRTLERQKEDALNLSRLHPDVVKVVQKTTKTAWGGATRTDVVIRWKKAYESSKERR